MRAHFPGLCHQFTSDALWSPRSPRCIDAAHDWRTLPPGTAGSSVPAFPFAQSSSVPAVSCIARVRVVDAALLLRAGLPPPVSCPTPVPSHLAHRPGTSSRYSNRKEGDAVPAGRSDGAIERARVTANERMGTNRCVFNREIRKHRESREQRHRRAPSQPRVKP